ncbi:MAG: hypothetical protein K2X38_16545 [Gemmataceae bacterium]|nr:hypothetical protein [Gemmataceae bacterium]
MTQKDLNRQIARRTGESVKTIRRLGFSRWPAVVRRKQRSHHGEPISQ